MQEHPIMEIFFLLLTSYLSYVLSEMFNFSGIMTIFCCGFTMSHYAYYNVSDEGKNGSVLTVSTLGYAAEAFLFTYLGLGIFSIDQENFSLEFCLLVIVAGCIGRAAAVFLPMAVYSLANKCRITVNLK